jgi:hypothetical protein
MHYFLLALTLCLLAICTFSKLSFAISVNFCAEYGGKGDDRRKALYKEVKVRTPSIDEIQEVDQSGSSHADDGSHHEDTCLDSGLNGDQVATVDDDGADLSSTPNASMSFKVVSLHSEF